MRENGRTDPADLYAVLAAGRIAHLGVLVDGHPMVVPTVYGFDDERIFLHGSVASRSLTTGAEVCVTVTVVDGLVLARSVFEHGINYRSAMIYGVPQTVTDDRTKLYGLRVLTEHVAPGQWDYARKPSRKELAATTLLALPLTEASVKIRTGPPDDGDGPDAVLGLWAGELPVVTTWGTPTPDPALPGSVPVPPHIAAYAGRSVESTVPLEHQYVLYAAATRSSLLDLLTHWQPWSPELEWPDLAVHIPALAEAITVLVARGRVELFLDEVRLVAPADVHDVVTDANNWWSPGDGTLPETALVLVSGLAPLPRRRR
jgi:hypothetical protein